jgi:hypothetical protein
MHGKDVKTMRELAFSNSKNISLIKASPKYTNNPRRVQLIIKAK